MTRRTTKADLEAQLNLYKTALELATANGITEYFDGHGGTRSRYLSPEQARANALGKAARMVA